MAGNRGMEEEKLELVMTDGFLTSLQSLVQDWEEVGLTEEKISEYVVLIQSSLESLKCFPRRFADVSGTFGFSMETRRIQIGRLYAIFYRIDQEKEYLLIGPIYHQRQLRQKF